MRSTGRLTLFICALAVAVCAAPAASAATTRFERIAGYNSPGTPAKYNKVGILEIGSPKAKNVLVLNPGTSASAAYFAPLARSVVATAKGWQVWAVERRENLLEDQSTLDKAKAHKITPQRLSDYYVGWIENQSITSHFRLIPDSEVGFAREWGMNTEIQDLRHVVLRAQKRGGKVVVGGHSLGGSITTAYATWDFGGKPGAKGLAGLVYIDGGSGPTPITKDDATKRLQDLQNGTPWLSFGGLPTPFAGLFNALGDACRDRAERAVDGPGSQDPAGQPEAAGPGHEHGAVRLRARHRHVARRRWSPRRRTWVTWRRRATRAAGTTRTSSHRCTAMRMPSPAGASGASTAPPGITRCG
jgi:pimeloyl-ACP methyl ester carboxylesterase